MKKIIFRNVGLVTAIFIVTLSIMLVVNYFQTGSTTPLQAEVLETLKQINDANAENTVLQEQIRQLDLLARKAYFTQHDRLVAGIYILVGMLIVFFICARGYFAGQKNIPEKEIDPVDEWLVKTKARGYIIYGAAGFVATAIVFAILTSPRLRTAKTDVAMQDEHPSEAITQENLSEGDSAFAVSDEKNAEPDAEFANTDTASANVDQKLAELDTAKAKTNLAITTTPSAEAEQLPKVTHTAFRGNNSNGVSAAKNIPTKWNLADGTNIAWKKAIPRRGFNSPVIHGRKVFITGADAQARELYCYDLFTGEPLWTAKAEGVTGSPAKMPETTDDTGLAASTAATNGKQVFAIFATGDLICADLNGKMQWTKNIGVPDNHYGYASSLITFGNLVIVQYDNQNAARVIAFDAATGAERWNKTRQGQACWSSPVIAQANGVPQLVLMGVPAITALNPATGEQVWNVDCLTGEVASSACAANGVVYGASEYAKFVAINAADGSLLWEKNDYLPEVASPAATKNNVYMATSYGMAISFDTQTGDPRKEHEFGTAFYSSPMIADGKVYLFDTDGKAYIFSADNDFRLLDTFDTGEKTFATPAFTDGRIVIRTNESIYCVAVPQS